MQVQHGRPVIVRTAAGGPLAGRWPPGQAGSRPPLGSDAQAVQVAPAYRNPGSDVAQSVDRDSIRSRHSTDNEENAASSGQFISHSYQQKQVGQSVISEGRHSIGDAMQAADVLTARVDEALSRLTNRLDEAVVELRTEVPELRQESESQRAFITSTADTLSRRIEEVFAAIAEFRTEVPQLRQEDESQRSMLTSMSVAHDALASRVDALEHGLAAEVQMRSDLEKALGKDLREYVLLELERMRDAAMREMRERMDGQKVLREEVQLQQGSLMRLTSKVDESLVELRTELPRLELDISTGKNAIEKVEEMHAASLERLSAVEQNLMEEAAARTEGEKALGRDTQQCIANETERLTAQQEDLQRLLEEQRARMDITHTDMKAALCCVEQITREARVQRDSVDLMSQQLRETREMSEQQAHAAWASLGSQLEAAKRETEEKRFQLETQVHDLSSELREWTDGRISETEAMMRNWVDNSVVSRLNTFDRALRKEMTERASTNQQVLDKITHNAERWCQLQAKFDELLIEVHRAGPCGDRTSVHLDPDVSAVSEGAGDQTSLSSSSAYQRA